jgi:hypothetical protein
MRPRRSSMAQIPRAPSAMISCRSELTSARLAREWPHWVAVRADQVAARHGEVLAFCRSLSLAPRHPTVRRNDVDYVLFASPPQIMRSASGSRWTASRSTRASAVAAPAGTSGAR